MELSAGHRHLPTLPADPDPVSILGLRGRLPAPPLGAFPQEASGLVSKERSLLRKRPRRPAASAETRLLTVSPSGARSGILRDITGIGSSAR